jgi:hypothetical protein
VPVHPQVGDRPGLRFGDQEPGRAHRRDLAARGHPGPQRGDEPVAEAVAGPVLKRRQHRGRHPIVGQQVARGGGARAAGHRRVAQRQLPGVARRAAGRVDHRQLPVGDVGRAAA